MSGGEAGFDFSHARLRDVAYDEIGLARRRLLHRRVAEGLRVHAVAREDAGRLALIAGHKPPRAAMRAAAEAYREAGLRARDVYANRESLDHLSAALALGHPDIAGLQVAMGELRTVLGDYAGAMAGLEAAALVPSDERLPGDRAAAEAGCTLGVATW